MTIKNTGIKTPTAAELYKINLAALETPTVEVMAPSGFVFLFKKPSKFSTLFRYGRVPQVATTHAVQSWIDAGILEAGDLSNEQANNIDLAMQIRDRVLELSIEPKLVTGAALASNELSTDDVADDDLQFLLNWVSAGGDARAASSFLRESSGHVMASRSRKKRRVPSK